MSDTIDSALITGVATIVAALIALLAIVRDQRDKKREAQNRKNSTQSNGLPGGLPGRVIAAAAERKLPEPFSMNDVGTLFPDDTYSSFLPNDAEGGNYRTNYFVRASRGLYRVADRWRARR